MPEPTRRPPPIDPPAHWTNDPVPTPAAPEPAPESGGRDGPDPTRYGDWENKGIAIDF